MKKILLLGAAAAALAGLAAVVVVGLKLDALVKAGVETMGPKVTRSEVRLDKVKLSLLSGKGRLSGILVGNPKGYKSESAFKLGDIRVSVVPRSLLTETVVVREILIDSPEITLEGGLKENNLTALQKNVESYAPASAPEKAPKGKPEPAASKKVIIERFALRGGKVNLKLQLLAGRELTVALPDLELRDIGKNSNGATVKEAAAAVMGSVTSAVLKAAANSPELLGRGRQALEQLGQNAGKEASKLLQGLFKKR